MTHISPQSSVETLIEGCKEQNRLAQQYLYKHLYKRLIGVAGRYTRNRDEAESIFNLALLKVFQSIDVYVAKAPFEAWVYRIIVNTAIDEMRRNVKVRHITYEPAETDGTDGNTGLENLEVEDIFRCIQKLDPATRTVFSLYEIEGFKHAEIGDMMGITENTSKWYLAKAKRELRGILAAGSKTPGAERSPEALAAVAAGITLTNPLF